jgi:hypothetical protein
MLTRKQLLIFFNVTNEAVMANKSTNRSRLVTLRLTPKEYQILSNRFKGTTCRKLSDYMRKVLLEQKLTMYTRNQSLDDFMTEMILLRSELNAIGNNFNQAVHRLHTLDKIPEFVIWIKANELQKKELLAKVEQIKLRIEKISDKWLQ